MTPAGADPKGERARAHAEALQRSRDHEAQQATALIERFVADAGERGVPTTRLRARSYDGNARYKTNIEGWYIRRDESIGIGTDGGYYVLSTPTSLAARFTGVTLRPSPPPLEVGRGSKDGESLPLEEALRRVLERATD